MQQTSTKSAYGRRKANEIVGVLAHELRNPLASLQGCALTLMDRADQLTPKMAEGLTRVIVTQSERLDWLIRATAAYSGLGSRQGVDEVELADVVEAAAEFAQVPVVVGDRTRARVDPRRVKLAVEALLVAIRGAAAEATATLDGAAFEVHSTARDIEQGERAWKLELARRLLREEGATYTIRRTPDGLVARVRFGAHATNGSRRKT